MGMHYKYFCDALKCAKSKEDWRTIVRGLFSIRELKGNDNDDTLQIRL